MMRYLMACSVALAASWLAAGPSVGFILERSDKTTAKVGWVRLFPPSPVTGTSNIEVIDAVSNLRVGADVLWQRPGEPVLVRFDASAGAARYLARLETSGRVYGPVWRPQAGLVLETRTRLEGGAEKLAEVRDLWRRAVTQGRGFVPNIHLGINPYGASGDVICRLDGWLRIAQDGRYDFATLSKDASFLLIDGRLVAEWPGWHGIEGGLQGQHSGGLNLKTGDHRIEYLNVANGDGLCFSAAWRPPGAAAFAPLAQSVFVPAAEFCVSGVTGDTAVVAATFSWANEVYVLAEPDSLLVGTRFRVLNPANNFTYHWLFDDGTEAEGLNVRHVFTCEALRTVELVVSCEGRKIGALRQTVAIQRHWAQGAEFPEMVLDDLVKLLRETTPDRLQPDDLTRAILFASHVKKRDLLGALAAGVMPRMHTFSGAKACALYQLGFYFQQPDVSRYGDVRLVWEAVVNDTQADVKLRALAGLHLAGFLIHTGIDPIRALKLLDMAVDDAAMSEAERRLKCIFQADGLVLTGHREAAVAAYRRAGVTVANGDTVYEVRRRVRLENARDFLRRREYDATEQVVRDLEWECPLERLELESGLIMIGVYRGRSEGLLALTACQRLLLAAPSDPRRPELLLAMADVLRAIGRTAECAETLKKLYSEHPYSEAAAQARDRM